MSRFLLPAGMVALVLTTLTVAAQVREEPKQAPPAVRPQAVPKGLNPDRDVAPNKKGRLDRAKSAEKKSRRRNRVYLGVYTVPVEDLSNRTRKKMKLQNMDGVIVVDVMPDSPADEAGIRHGDVITHVNGKLVDDEEELSDDLNQLGAGKPVKLAVIRDGKKQEIKAELEESPAGEFPGMGVPQEVIEEIMGISHHNAQRIERLERQVSRLEKRLADMQKTRSGRVKE